jgi:hypothetical protein
VLEEIVVKDVERDVRLAAARCLRDARAVSRLLQKEDLDPGAVEVFDDATFASALKEYSNSRSLRELAQTSPFDRIRSEALRACEDLSRELSKCLSESRLSDIDKLLDQGANPNVVDERGRPALCVLARQDC